VPLSETLQTEFAKVTQLAVWGQFRRMNLLLLVLLLSAFLTSQRWLGNIHLFWDLAINRVRFGGLICSLKSFLQLNMFQELQIFAVVYMYWCAS